VPAQRRILLIHQLTREIWFINSGFPLAHIGYALESHWLRIYKKGRAITVSDSTRDDLLDAGFRASDIQIVENGMEPEITAFRNADIVKETAPTFIYVGRFAAYKGIDICIESFGKLKKKHPDARLWLVGKKDDSYIDEKLRPMCSRYGITMGEAGDEDADVIIWGFVTEEKKYELMKRATLLLFPSIREGWGIIVTEAAYLGTVSLVTDAPGSRDAVCRGRAGFICPSRDPSEFAQYMQDIIEDPEKYAIMQKKAYDFAAVHFWDSDEQKKKIRETEDFITGIR
jgi:glycosyltransferase involved in cell wall biosynthesis